MFACADRHQVYTPAAMGADQEAFAERLTSRNINATHWILTEKPDGLIAEVQDFVQKVGLGGDGLNEKVKASVRCLAPKH